LRRSSGKDGEAISRRILEVNDGHELVRKLRALHAASPDDVSLADLAHLLLGSALLAEGTAPPDPATFAVKLTALMTRAL
jgi:molecular chaperone HtpG